MSGQFTPLGSSAVQFAKTYRAEQIRDAGRFRRATKRRTAHGRSVLSRGSFG